MRRSIALFATSGLLPIVALGAVFGATTLIGQRHTTEATARAHAQFAAMLIAAQLDDQRREVAMIAQSPAFDTVLDARRFTELARRLLAQQPDWQTLSLATPRGLRLIDVPQPIAGVARGAVIDRASLARMVATRAAVIGEPVRGPTGQLAFAVRAPVIRHGVLRYALSAVVRTGRLTTMLDFRQLPARWRAVVIDGHGIVVAANPGAMQTIGHLASAAARQARRSGSPAAYHFTRDDGTDAVGVYARVEGTDWTVNVSSPASLYAGPSRQALVLAMIASLVCALLFLLLVRLLYAELRQSREREDAAVQIQRMEALGRLTGGIAHDFNNLLTPIIGGLDMLQRRVRDDPRAVRSIELALASAERAKTLVGRLLSFARHQQLAPRDVELGALLRGLSDLLDRSLTPAITLIVPPAATRVFARVDPAQLELAVINLAINARDAMGGGGGILTILCRPATAEEVQALSPGAYVTIVVEDTGTGMDAATRARALDPFFTTKEPGKGTGLGLSMVHGFAVQSGGTVLIDSAPGAGTRIAVVLPAADHADAPAQPAGTARQAMPPKRILLVDDDDAARETVAAMLAEAGHDVVAAASVDAAARQLDTSPAPDLIITDYLMPDRTGLDLIEIVRRERPALPVLLITGYVGDDVELGDSVMRLRKPFGADELLACVAQAGRSPAGA
jgi:signal transduction histidine kinase/CheY-like chemotaxis protein